MTLDISKEDLKLVNEIKKNIGQVYGNNNAENLPKNNSRDEERFRENSVEKGQEVDGDDIDNYQQNSPSDKGKVEKVSTKFIEKIEKDFIKLDTNLTEIDARKEMPGKEKKLSPEKLKEYYQRASKHFEKTNEIINKALENDQTINPNEQDQLRALAKTIELTMQKLNQKQQAEQQQIEKELEKIRQIEEHEKKKEKGFLGKAAEEANKAFDALAAIILPPDWYDKAKENETAIENTKLKDKPKSVNPEPTKEQEVKQDNNVGLSSLGQLSPSKVPNVSQGIGKNQGISH